MLFLTVASYRRELLRASHKKVGQAIAFRGLSSFQGRQTAKSDRLPH
jgi:hypothetical protein